jgi:BASS family bile acid:Na+ symporter
MNDRRQLVAAVSRLLTRHFIWLLLGSYVVAAFRPAFGLWIRDVTFGEVTLFKERTKVTLPMVMLAVLLLNAGLGVPPSRLKNSVRGSLVLAAGLTANLLIPIVFIFAVVPVTCFWLDPDEAQNLLLGLALIASMPIAGSSAAWSQNTDGDLVLSLGLVVFSTLLSPVTTPLSLRSVGLMATGDYAEDLRRLAGHGTGPFLTLCVTLPSLLGIFLSWAVGENRVAQARSHLKLLNSLNLLLLIYSNASICLPRAIAYPDIDFLAVVLGTAVSLCVIAFASGWWIARLLKLDPARRTSLTFGLGMNNNGTGLVLAALALSGHPRVMLPLITYNLVQHLAAGGVALLLGRSPAGQEAASAEPGAASVTEGQSIQLPLSCL